jgi:hypothetical protein
MVLSQPHAATIIYTAKIIARQADDINVEKTICARFGESLANSDKEKEPAPGHGVRIRIRWWLPGGCRRKWPSKSMKFFPFLLA